MLYPSSESNRVRSRSAFACALLRLICVALVLLYTVEGEGDAADFGVETALLRTDKSMLA